MACKEQVEKHIESIIFLLILVLLLSEQTAITENIQQCLDFYSLQKDNTHL